MQRDSYCLHINSAAISYICRDVLCNPGFKEYVNGNMLFWACDVNTYEGYRGMSFIIIIPLSVVKSTFAN